MIFLRKDLSIQLRVVQKALESKIALQMAFMV